MYIDIIVFIRQHKGLTQLVILDHGLYEQLSDQERIALSNLWQAIVFNNQANMKTYSTQLGVEGLLQY